jgi:hypothetical protein
MFYWAGKTVRPRHRQKIAERTPEETTGKREMVVKEPDCTMDVCITAARTREKESNLFGLQPEEVSAGSEMQQRDRRRSSRCLRRRDDGQRGEVSNATTPRLWFQPDKKRMQDSSMICEKENASVWRLTGKYFVSEGRNAGTGQERASGSVKA